MTEKSRKNIQHVGRHGLSAARAPSPLRQHGFRRIGRRSHHSAKLEHSHSEHGRPIGHDGQKKFAGMKDAEDLPVFQLTELVDELARDSDDENDISDPAVGSTKEHLRSLGAGGVAAASELDEDGAGPSFDRTAGERAATAFWRCCQANGLTAFCDALTYSGLRDELPRLAESGITVLAPTNEAFAQIAETARGEQRLVRQLILGHICSGTSTMADVRAKNCAVAVAGQTHACYNEEGYTYVGTSRLGRTDIAFEGGVIHEVTSCLMVLSLVRDSHSEQVWKKALQPAPVLAALGGVSALGVEFEVHGCLLHAATGQLVPEALRGHVRPIRPINDEQRLTFAEITIMTKPPSLAKRRGAAGAPDGSNRYRLLFSIWNTTSLSYISWQHMATPLVVRVHSPEAFTPPYRHWHRHRPLPASHLPHSPLYPSPVPPIQVRNSFHMLPIEEKNYRRQMYARARSGGSKADKGMACSSLVDDVLPPLPEGEVELTGAGAEGAWSPVASSGDNPLADGAGGGGAGDEGNDDVRLKRLSIGSEARGILDDGEMHLRQLQTDEMGDGQSAAGAAAAAGGLPHHWLPLSQAMELPDADHKSPGRMPRAVAEHPRYSAEGHDGSESESHDAHSSVQNRRELAISTDPPPSMAFSHLRWRATHSRCIV